MSRPYQPSNGTEGEMFMERWCYRCAKLGEADDPGRCGIIDRSWAFGIDDPGYPTEWTIEGVDLATAKCSAFTTEPPREKLCPKCNGLGLIKAGFCLERQCAKCGGKGSVQLK